MLYMANVLLIHVNYLEGVGNNLKYTHQPVSCDTSVVLIVIDVKSQRVLKSYSVIRL